MRLIKGGEEHIKKLKSGDFFKLSTVIFAAVFCLFCFAFPNISAEAVKNALELCGKRLVPSLFPILVVTSFLSSGSFFSRSHKWLEKPLRVFFGVPRSLSSVALLSLFAGYPSAALASVQMYKNGLCTKSEAEYTLAIASNPSAAFICAAVGFSVLGSRFFGIILFLCMLISLIFTSAILRKLYPSDAYEKPLESDCKKSAGGLSKRITTAISSSVKVMTEICGYVIFFSAASEAVCFALDTFPIFNDFYETLIKGFFEISGGVYSASSPYIHRRILLIAAVCGWSGISVLFQIAGIICERGLSVKPYLTARALMCFIYPTVLLLFMLLLPRLVP